MESGCCWSRVFKHPFNYLLSIAVESHGTISSTLLLLLRIPPYLSRPFAETKTIRVGRFKTPSTKHSPQELNTETREEPRPRSNREERRRWVKILNLQPVLQSLTHSQNHVDSSSIISSSRCEDEWFYYYTSKTCSRSLIQQHSAAVVLPQPQN